MGIGRRGKMLVTSKVESANDMHAMSGSLLSSTIVLCENTVRTDRIYSLA